MEPPDQKPQQNKPIEPTHPHPSHKTHGLEISPEDAALRLGVHPRTIRNFIKRGTLKAVKVNNKWYVDLKSVDALLTQPKAPEGVGSDRSSRYSMEPQVDQGPRVLAPYRLSCHLFLEMNWDLDLPQMLRVKQLQSVILEALGSGFYSYGFEKKRHYLQARSAMGGIIGLLHPYRYHQDIGPKLRPLLDFLEEECLQAIASLIRKIERKQGAPI